MKINRGLLVARLLTPPRGKGNTMSRHCLLLISVLVAVGPFRLVATSQARSAPLVSSRVTDPDTEIARRHYIRGSALYNAGNYAEATVEFEAARKVKPLSGFDYNIARCHDRLERTQEAVSAYERYLAAAPDAADAAELRARVAVLKRRLAPTAPAPTVVAPPIATARPTPVPIAPAPTAAALPAAVVPPIAPPLTRHRRYTWIVGGAGAALLAGSLVAGLVANARYGDLKSNCALDGACDATVVPSAQNWIDSARSAGLASDVLLGVGAAVAITGTVLYFVEGRRPAERQAWRITPMLNVGGDGLSTGFTIGGSL